MKLKALHLKETLTRVALMACLFITPLLSFAQEGPGVPGDDGGDPGAVPFDSNMNLMFLSLGVAFAVFIMVRQWRKKASSVAS